MNRLGAISVQTVILLLIMSGILIGLFYIIKHYVIPYLGSRNAVKKGRKLTYRIEVIVWSVFIFFGLYQLLSDSLYITTVLLVVIILAGRNYWRDMIAGVIFRMEDKFKEGDPVSYENYNGILDKIAARNIQIKTDKEEMVLIPFRKVSDAIFVKRQAKGKLHSAQLSLPVGDRSVQEVMDLIHGWIYQCPWAIMNEKVSAKILGPGLIQVSVYAVDKESIDKTEEYLMNKLRKSN